MKFHDSKRFQARAVYERVQLIMVQVICVRLEPKAGRQLWENRRLEYNLWDFDRVE